MDTFSRRLDTYMDTSARDTVHVQDTTFDTITTIGTTTRPIADTIIAYNRITDVPRYAVSFKSQGEDSLAHRNVAEFNEIRRCNLETNDSGAFETLGYERRDSGNVIRYNLVLDSVGMATTPAGKGICTHTPPPGAGCWGKAAAGCWWPLGSCQWPGGKRSVSGPALSTCTRTS